MILRVWGGTTWVEVRRPGITPALGLHANGDDDLILPQPQPERPQGTFNDGHRLRNDFALAAAVRGKCYAFLCGKLRSMLSLEFLPQDR